MKITDFIIAWIYSKVRIPVSRIYELAEKLDADKDEYISIEEIIKAVRGWIR